MKALRDPHRDKSKALPLPPWLKPVVPRQRADPSGKMRNNGLDKDPTSSGHWAHTNQFSGSEFTAETLESWAARYSMEDSHEPLRHHKLESSSANFVGRQAAWSPGGEWCVVVGSSNTTLVLQRWSKKAPAQSSTP